MLAETLERVQFSPSKRTMYVRVILTALAAIIVFKTFRFFWWGLWQGHSVADFASFHIVARHAWLGDIDLAYKFQAFMKMQAEAASGATDFMPWTYPPQFNLLLAPLAFLPVWAAYFLFAAATLAFYLMTLRSIAGNNFLQVLVILFPAVALNIATGQNGLLTGALIGLVCTNVQKRQVSGQLLSGQLLSGQVLAGLALGAMVIKPHLAIAVSVYLLATRRWAAIATAATVVLVSSLLCTLVFGLQIWAAWLGAIRESTSFLEQGSYKLFRMISGYAALYSAGAPAMGAFWGQTVMAGLALLGVVLGIVRRVSPSFALGVSAMVSVMISPYAYDYDLPIAGIGLALLLPDLVRLATARERNIIYGLVLLAGAYGLIQSTRLTALSRQDLDQHFTPAVAGLAMMVLLALLLRILLRKTQPALASSPEPVQVPPHPARVLE